MFNTHNELIFSVINDKWTELEQAQKKGSKSHLAELTQCLAILKKMLIHLQELIRKQWKHDRIGNIILQCLAINNKHSTRMLGWELLLLFIQANRTPRWTNLHDKSEFLLAMNKLSRHCNGLLGQFPLNPSLPTLLRLP